SGSCTGSRVYNLAIDCPTVNITPSSLPNGTVGAFYSQPLGATGGTPPHTFVVETGALPGNVSLSPAGIISGTPTGPGVFNFTVLASSDESCTGDHAYSISVGAAGANGDIDGSGSANGIDIQLFVNCVLTGSTPGGSCSAADFDSSGGVDAADVAG